MAEQSTQLVQKLWNYCNILRDDGLSYGDYVEQLTFLLFLKMADEQSRPPFNKRSPIPKGFDWASLLAKDGDELEIHYRHLLETLGREKGMLGVIFRKAQNKIQDPAKLRRLIVDLIDKEQWTSLSADVKGDAYEGLLEKNAADVKGGAGQYFTPRPLIAAIVDVMRPEPKMTICDPACGTGGFLLAAYNYLSESGGYKLDRAEKKRLATETLYGVELVDGVARLCCMNMLLHGISADGADQVPIEVRDALGSQGGKNYEMVMTKPPFGKKSSVTIVNEKGEAEKESLTIHRDDFWASTSNKQQPAQEKAWTDKLWIYDFRTNKHFTLKENQLKRSDLDDFVACYHATNRHERTESERFKCFTYDDLAKRDKVNLDIFWLKDESLEDSANLPPPDIIAAEIVEDLEAALAQFAEIASDLGGEAKLET